ncbi:hypothetical protein ARALYDRAFT_311310 [Arabidopsis lyrata subsp. lyrata]|uniref:Uncharacterized protein n=1 Tax=Arabidopsis lyrata subsp. lyrata TaxID=81972 RepID=D7KQ98_ARALL|nr:hypothetical protein ARALYDRAFT_311310 [Arabidopsis lyrata subsp. lyrata]
MDWTVIPRSRAESHEMLCHAARDYSRRLDESEVSFRYRGNISTTRGHSTDTPTTVNCLIVGILNLSWSSFMHASAGLHRYNMLEVQVNELRTGRLDMIVPIARPKGVTTKKPLIPWDSFSVKESELQNNDWIYLYLQLVLCAIERVIISDGDLSKLKIVKATQRQKCCVVYITFKGLANARIAAGEHDERKAIIRRILNEHTGYLSLIGDLIGENEFVNIDPATFFNSPAFLEALDRGQELLPRSPWM